MKQPTFGHQSWEISESFVIQVSLVLNNCHKQFALLGSNKKTPTLILRLILDNRLFQENLLGAEIVN